MKRSFCYKKNQKEISLSKTKCEAILRDFILWFGYTICGVWIQTILPGVDCFAPALIVCLQRKTYIQAIFWGIIWVIIQEGTSGIAFGTSVLWYLGLTMFFLLIRNYLIPMSVFFLISFSLITGCWHWIVIYVSSSLQNLQIDLQHLFTVSLQMCILFPLLWIIIFLIHNWFIKNHA